MIIGMDGTARGSASELLKQQAVRVYICQFLTIIFAGLPLLIGLFISLRHRREAQGSWLASHFDWQIQTVWMVAAGVALIAVALRMNLALSLIALLATTALLAYRTVAGWNALLKNQPVK